jgi:hypothetical protein
MCLKKCLYYAIAKNVPLKLCGNIHGQSGTGFAGSQFGYQWY